MRERGLTGERQLYVAPNRKVCNVSFMRHRVEPPNIPVSEMT